jgi:hypothetical protein
MTTKLSESELAVCRATWTDPADFAARKTQRASASASARAPRGSLTAAEREIARVFGRTESEQLARLGRKPLADEEASDDDVPEVSIEGFAHASSRGLAFGMPGRLDLSRAR